MSRAGETVPIVRELADGTKKMIDGTDGVRPSPSYIECFCYPWYFCEVLYFTT